MEQVPTISLAALCAGDEEEIQSLGSALASSGFFHLTLHQLDAQELPRLAHLAKSFADLPSPAKAQTPLGADFTGWVPFGTGRIATSHLNPVPVPDLYEAFLIKRRMIGDDLSWPRGLPEFRRAAENHFRTMEAIGRQLLRPTALALGVAPDFFDPYFRDAEATLRVNLYPSVDQVPEGAFRMAPHIDSGFLTLLPGESLEGLEVMIEQEWTALNARPGTIAVNTGELLARWSNGVASASAHRVRAGVGKSARCTTPFFYSPNRSALIEPLPNGRAPEITPIRFGDFLDTFMRSNLPDTPPGRSVK
jgi:isopenicillin N synthase-like dioxygenase